MTTDEFFNKWNNQPCDSDKSYGNQCVDLADQYSKDVLGVILPEVNGAIDLWTKYPKDKFDAIPKSDIYVPKKGDIVIWGDKIGRFGHIDIAVSVNPNGFLGFDQNWPAQFYTDKNGNQIGIGVCHYQQHTYFGVLGWLRPKSAIITPIPLQPMEQKYSFRQVIQFFYRIFCNADPSDSEYQNWEQKQKDGWNEIQIGQEILTKDSRAIALWHTNTNLANFTVRQLAQAIVDR